MSQEIFRKAAFERLASPEQLDRVSQLVRPRGWIAFGAMLAVVVAAAMWGMVARAPVKVDARGIIFQEGILLDVASVTAGRIVELNLKLGSRVSEGDIIARLARFEIELDLQKTHSDLADARSRFVELRAFYADDEGRETIAEKARIDTIQDTQAQVVRRVSLLEEKVDSIRTLFDRKLVIRDRLLEAELDLANARERVLQLENEKKTIALRRLERESKTRFALLDEQLKINELERRLKRQEAQLSEEQFIRSPHAGRVVEIKANMGDVVSPGTQLVTLMREGAGGEGVIALMYVSPGDGRRVERGMPVEVVPSTVQKTEFGFIRGSVEGVSDVASTVEGMRNILKNEQLVQRLSGDGAPIAVQVRLERDPRTVTGLRWSSSEGPNRPITVGTLLSGAIVVDTVPVISLLAPGLDRAFGATSD